MKNIVYIHDARFVSGLERMLLDTFKAIDKTRFTPYFIGSKTGSEWSDGHFIKLAKESGIKYSVTNLRFVYRTLNPLVLMIYFYDLLVSFASIYNFMRRNKIDIILASSLHDVYYSFLPALILKKPIIWHSHAIRHVDEFSRFIVSILDIKVKKYIAASKAVKNSLCLQGIDSAKIDVIYNIVDVNKFFAAGKNLHHFYKKYSLGKDVRLIGMVARFQEGKGHEDFLEAARIILNTYNDVKFLLLGPKFPSKYVDKIEKLIQDLRLTDKLIYIDWIENVEEVIPSLYALVQPSYIEEASSVVLYETMASGVPVIGTRSGGTPEIIKDGLCGYIVNKRDPKSIAEKLKFLLDNPDIAKNMGQKGREIAEKNFAPSEIIKKLETIFESVSRYCGTRLAVMKNILYIHDARFVSGLERALLGIFKATDKRKFKAYFIGSKWNDGHFIKLTRELKIKYIETNLKFASRTCNPFILIIYLFDFFISSIDIYNFARQNKIDIILANSLHDVFYAFIPALILKKPIIWYEQAIRPADAFRHLIISILDIKIKKYVAASEAVKRGLNSLGVRGEKIDVIYNAVDLDKFSADKEKPYQLYKTYNLKQDIRLIGLISQFQPGKGHEDFLEAAKIISNEYNNVKFLIVGRKSPSKYFDKIEGLTKTLKLTEKVIFTDWIENIEDITLSLYALVQPTYTEEAFGIVLIEAMASGVPVIGTRSGGIPEVIKDGVCGYLVNKRDPKAIAEKLKFLLDNPQIAKNMGGKGRGIAIEKFDLLKMIMKFQNIYEKFLYTQKATNG